MEGERKRFAGPMPNCFLRPWRIVANRQCRENDYVSADVYTIIIAICLLIYYLQPQSEKRIMFSSYMQIQAISYRTQLLRPAELGFFPSPGCPGAAVGPATSGVEPSSAVRAPAPPDCAIANISQNTTSARPPVDPTDSFTPDLLNPRRGMVYIHVIFALGFQLRSIFFLAGNSCKQTVTRKRLPGYVSARRFTP